MDKKTLLFICTASNTVINFRKELILFLIKLGYKIHLICGDNEREEEIRSLGISTLHILNFSNRSINPFQFLKTKKEIRKISNEINPYCILTFQAKPNIATAFALKNIHFPIISFVEGLGIIANKTSIRNRFFGFVTSRMYKKAFKRINKVFVLNEDDKNYLLNNKFLSESKLYLINGIGIDCDKYQKIERFTNEKNVIMLSRLALDKGVLNYCEIAKLVRQSRKDINFFLYGEQGNLRLKKIQPYIDSGDLIYKGFTKDVKSLFKNFRILALPSNIREGLPRTLMEASASGLPCIIYDIVGSKEVVMHNKTGLVIENNNTKQYADSIIKLIDNTELLNTFGTNASLLCKEKFDSNVINAIIAKQINFN